MTKRILIVGVGRPEFGDDAAGIEIAARLRERAGDVAEFMLDSGSGWDALDADGEIDLLVVIDAAEATGCFPAGEWRRIEYPRQMSVIEECALRDTHTMSVETMLRLARQLDRLPGEVWIYAVAGKSFEPESAFSPDVQSVLEEVTDSIEKDVRARVGGGGKLDT